MWKSDQEEGEHRNMEGGWYKEKMHLTYIPELKLEWREGGLEKETGIKDNSQVPTFDNQKNILNKRKASLKVTYFFR